MSPLKLRRGWTLIGYGLIILIVALSLSPSISHPVSFPQADKLFHIMAYGTLMLWFAQLHPKSGYGWLAGSFIALGILMEILQYLLGTRSGDVWDVAANSLGVILSWGLAVMGMNTLFHQFEARCLKRNEEG